MKWTCGNSHLIPAPGAGYAVTVGRRECRSFGAWLMCKVVDRGGWLSDPGSLVSRLTRFGLIDADGEGGLMFWRLDFWNAYTRRTWRGRGKP